MRDLLFACALNAVMSTAASAGTVPLFNELQPADGGDTAPGVIAIHPITLNFPALPLAPSRLLVELPEDLAIVVDLDLFEPRAGFDETGLPIPDSAPEDFSYLWRGAGEGYVVVLTMVDGFLSGLVDGPADRYLIGQELGGDALSVLDPDGLTEEPVEDPFSFLPELVSQNRDALNFKREALGGGRPIQLDVLYLYTNSARIDAGGNPSDPLDTGAIRSLIQGAVDDTNFAFEQSNLNHIRIRAVHDELLQGFTPSGTSNGFISDLRDLRTDSDIQALRNAVDADFVSVILRNQSSGGPVFFCGYAFVQRPGCDNINPIPDCGVGESFSEYAFHWVAQNCMRTNFTFTHELGHNLGCEHHPESTSITPDEASFPWSFAHRVYTPVSFGTIMAPGSGAVRKLHFSNPDINFEGVPTGIVDERENARTIDALAPIAANFRNATIFSDGFENGDETAWTLTLP